MMGASTSATRRKASVGAVCVTLMCLAFGAAVFTDQARARELGLTPSHVFGLWTNINAALVSVGDASSGGQNLDDSLTSTKPDRFENKKPADVLARAIEVRAKLDRLLAEHGMAPTKRYPRGAGRVTPSVVFLNSGLLLDAVVGWRHEPFYCGENDRGRAFNDLGLLLRDAEHVERFRDLARQEATKVEPVNPNERRNSDGVVTHRWSMGAGWMTIGGSG